MKEILDVVYGKINDIPLKLDLFLPEKNENPPLIMWIHGGAWMMGDRKWCGLQDQIKRGYAVASIDYRLSTVSPFPACIIDCKNALAFLRKNENKYPIDVSKICVAGDSAGGHLAALMGVSAGHSEWEPEGSDCSVQAVIDFYGQITFKEEGNSPDGNNVINTLLGASINTPKGLMIGATASPLTYIKGNEPPFLIIHGDQDEIVQIEHSYLLRNELEKYGQKNSMYTVFGGGHGFNCPAVESIVNTFLDYHLKDDKEIKK